MCPSECLSDPVNTRVSDGRSRLPVMFLCVIAHSYIRVFSAQVRAKALKRRLRRYRIFILEDERLWRMYMHIMRRRNDLGAN